MRKGGFRLDQEPFIANPVIVKCIGLEKSALNKSLRLLVLLVEFRSGFIIFGVC